MKQFYLLLALCLALIKADAANIVGYEYFWDTDPGIGNATGTFGSTFVHADSVNITKTITTAGLSTGNHYLYIRTIDSDGHWSLSEGMPVNVIPLIVGYEYFWDTDPGIGNATGIFGYTFIHADSVNITKTITTAVLSTGNHFLYIRTLDSDGHWSLSEGMDVNVVPIITRAEYFWDTDPGIGNGLLDTSFVHTDSVNYTKTLSTSSLSAGLHYFYLRTKDNEGKWSLAEGLSVNVVPIIKQAEYFWDNDPGIDNGTNINIPNISQLDSVNLTKTISTSGLNSGIHYLYLRTNDSEDKWSLAEAQQVNIVSIITLAEYFWDTDPGIGNGLLDTSFVHTDSVNYTKTLSTSSLSAGIHYLYVRTKDNEGKWSLSEGLSVNVIPIITHAEIFWDNDPGIDNGIGIPVGSPSDSVNINIPPSYTSTSSLSAGIHYLYVRTKDNFGHWSLSEGQAIEIKPYLVKGEYFLNTDPGIGNGTLAFNASGSPSDSINGSYNVNLPALPYGHYNHYLRTMDNFGHWSLAEPHAFDVIMNITQVEYFFDTDPGVGLGIDIPVTQDDTVIISNYSIATTSLQAGWHNLYIRAKNEANVWTVIDTRPFNIQEPLNPTYTSNTDIEYFFDTDPGVGAATQIPIADADTLSLSNQSIATTGLSVGFHQLYLRAKNSAGVWSVIDSRPFVIDVPPPPVTVITQVEYFYDTDPGVGNATSLELTSPPDDTVLVNTNKLVPCLANGTHYMWLRAKNNLGVWSVIAHDTLTVGGTMIAKSIASLGSDTVCSPATVNMFADSAIGIVYQWLDNGMPISGATFAKYTATVTGNYSLRQTCGASVVISNIKNVVVNLSSNIILTTSLTHVNCYGENSGAINLTTINAVPAVTYIWSNNAITKDISNLVIGTYTVTVTDANQCTASASAVIGSNTAAPTLSALTGGTLTCAATSINVTASATGQGLLSYVWSGGATPTTAANTFTAVGTYTVTVTDLANGCTASASIAIGSNITVANVSASAALSTICAGSSTILTGSGADTYTWMPGSLTGTTVSVSPVTTTTYTVTGTSANGCSGTTTVTVAVNTLFNANATSSNVLCKGNNTGAIVLSISGGSSVSFLWNNGATTQSRTNLYAGTYTVTITDICKTQLMSFTIYEPALGMLLTGTSKNPKCSTGATGSAKVVVSGGSGSYSYLWSNGQTNANATGLFGAAYTVTVSNAGSCTRSMTFILVAPSPISIALTYINPAGAPYNNGNVVAVASGGTPNYVYLWNTTPLKTTATITGLSAGTYMVKVTDKNSCTATNAATLINTGRADLSSNQEPLVKVNIMPNPSDGLFIVKAIAITESTATLELMDITGREVLSEQMPLKTGNNSMMLNAQTLPKGIYLLRFTIAHKIQTMRLVIQ